MINKLCKKIHTMIFGEDFSDGDNRIFLMIKYPPGGKNVYVRSLVLTEDDCIKKLKYHPKKYHYIFLPSGDFYNSDTILSYKIMNQPRAVLENIVKAYPIYIVNALLDYWDEVRNGEFKGTLSDTHTTLTEL